MPYVIITEPEGVNEQMYDAVSEKLDAGGPPPEELLVHTAGTDDSGKFRVVDVWTSREAHDRFREERLLPAIMEVAKERGGEGPSGPPQNNVYEAHNVQIAESAPAASTG